MGICDLMQLCAICGQITHWDCYFKKYHKIQCYFMGGGFSEISLQMFFRKCENLVARNTLNNAGLF